MPQGYLSVRLLLVAFLLVLAGCARDQQAERARPEPPRPTARSTTARLKRIPVKVLVPCGLASAFRDLAGQIHDDLPDIALTTRTLPVVEMTDKVLSGEIEATRRSSGCARPASSPEEVSATSPASVLL